MSWNLSIGAWSAYGRSHPRRNWSYFFQLPKVSLPGRNLMNSFFICVWMLISLMLCMPFPGNHRRCRFVMAMEDTIFCSNLPENLDQTISFIELVAGWLAGQQTPGIQLSPQALTTTVNPRTGLIGDYWLLHSAFTWDLGTWT